MTPKDKLQGTLDSLEQVLKSVGANKAPLVIRSPDDAITAANNTLKENVVPIFCISSVTGVGLNIVRRYKVGFIICLLPSCVVVSNNSGSFNPLSGLST